MGIYVYSVRNAEIDVTLLDGTKVVARPLSYLCKPYAYSHDNNKANRIMDMMQARAESLYEKKGIADYVILCADSQPSKYDSVYEYGFNHACRSDGLDGWAGKFVGYIDKVDGKWAVVTREEVELSMREDDYRSMDAGMLTVGGISNSEEYRSMLEIKDAGKPGSYPSKTVVYTK